MKLSEIHLNDGSHGLPKNPRFIKDDRFRALCDSIRENPEYMPARPIIVDEAGVILGGNMRYRACRELKMADIPDGWVMRVTGWPVEKKRRFILLDNQGFGENDWDILANEFTVEEMIAGGFDPDKLDEMINGKDGEGEQDAEPQIDKAEELNKVWKVKAGDLWQLGEHRLLCGDCTKADDVARVMGKEKAALVVTDPPYGVSYADKNSFLNSVGKGNRVQTKIESDHLSKEETQAMWKAAFSEMSKAMGKGAVVYCFMPQGGDQMMMMMMMMMGAGIEPRHELIWLKNNHVLGRVDYAYKHEPILYAWKEGGHKFYGDFQTSIIECNRPNKSELHPTTKPVELCERLVNNSSKTKDVVFDIFSGSGTTLIACENLNRKCRAIEISPAYVAVTLQRYQDATGKTPERIND